MRQIAHHQSRQSRTITTASSKDKLKETSVTSTTESGKSVVVHPIAKALARIETEEQKTLTVQHNTIKQHVNEDNKEETKTFNWASLLLQTKNSCLLYRYRDIPRSMVYFHVTLDYFYCVAKNNYFCFIAYFKEE